MKVYHGSYMEIVDIDLSKCERHKDFGQGFYVTKCRKHAEDWAAKMGSKYDTQGIVTEFEFYESAFTNEKYKVLRFDNYSDEWLEFVVMNRDRSTNDKRHTYDIVEGPIADDKVQNYLKNYLRGKISKEGFLNKLKYHEETHQICFCSLVSLQTLDRTDDTSVWEIEHIGESIVEALMLDRNIDEIAAADLFYTSDIFAQLADSNTSFYQKPWTEIYQLLQQELIDNGINDTIK
jgi:hypothetical protein